MNQDISNHRRKAELAESLLCQRDKELMHASEVAAERERLLMESNLKLCSVKGELTQSYALIDAKDQVRPDYISIVFVGLLLLVIGCWIGSIFICEVEFWPLGSSR